MEILIVYILDRGGISIKCVDFNTLIHIYLLNTYKCFNSESHAKHSTNVIYYYYGYY